MSGCEPARDPRGSGPRLSAGPDHREHRSVGGEQLPGFGQHPTRFISYVRLRSAQDRQRLFDDELLTGFLDAVGEIARADLHSYDVLRSFGPDG